MPFKQFLLTANLIFMLQFSTVITNFRWDWAEIGWKLTIHSQVADGKLLPIVGEFDGESEWYQYGGERILCVIM